jgi:hypothetical protein
VGWLLTAYGVVSTAMLLPVVVCVFATVTHHPRWLWRWLVNRVQPWLHRRAYGVPTRYPAAQRRWSRPTRLVVYFPVYGFAAAVVASYVAGGQTWSWRTAMWLVVAAHFGRKAWVRPKGLGRRTARWFERRAGDAWRGYA